MIFELIYKYLDNEASEEEVLIVFKWIETSEENKKQFIALKKAWAFTEISNETPAKALQEFYKKKQKKSSRKWYRFLRYAAIVLVFIGLGKTATQLFVPNSNPSKEIVLELSNGTLEYISKDKTKNVIDEKGNAIAKQSQDSIIYYGHAMNDKMVYNTLKIPYGQTFKVILSDGTTVHLNAGSILKYPQQFGLNTSRKVYLTGEAFFDVTKDKLHPFIVESNQVSVEVLGTKFNLSAYPDEKQIQTVLVEGSVRFSENANQKNSTILSPNHAATWNDSSNKFVTETVDVDLFTAWVQGELIFKDASFGSICKRMERAFDVTIVNSNSNLVAQKFTGTIKIKESKVEDILDLLKLDTPFKYSKKDGIIKITN
jgi:ferric-dicitrate binding protein FerR (iron transport regulator)